MSLKDTSTLAAKLGVREVRPGTITEVEGIQNQVLAAMAKHNLVLEMYDEKIGLKPDVYYFRVEGQILGATPEESPAPESGSTREKGGYARPVGIPRKPDGYKDGHRWV